MPNPTRSDVEKAVKRLQRFHQVGRDSLKRRGGQGAYGQRQVEAEAAKLRIEPGVFRKLRRFADEATGYSAAELNELCELCKRHDRAWGIKILLALLRVPRAKGQRRAVQKQAAENGWSASQLENEIRRRFGRRRSGGRRPAVPSDVEGVLCQLEAMCERWSRLHAELTAEDQPEPSHPRLRDLPGAVRRKFGDATEALRKHQSSLNRQLDRRRSSPTGR
jgi:hypothetical protein